jgi:hypothetical protein
MPKFDDQPCAGLMRSTGQRWQDATPPAAARWHLTLRRALLASGVGGLAAAGEEMR